jgi:hypothetical protein
MHNNEEKITMRILSKNLCKLKNGKIAFFEGTEPARKNRAMKKGESRMQKIELIKVTELNGEERHEHLNFEDMEDEPISKEDILYAIQFLSTLIEPGKDGVF